MYALDFEYDGQYLSDYGFIICNFDSSSGANSCDAGSKITFNLVPMHDGKENSMTGTKYDECITATFDICKNPEMYDDLEIANDEYRDIVRWLNRRGFYKFQVLDEEDKNRETCYYEASFNIEKIRIADVLYGIRLNMETNKPFGYGQEQNVSWTINDIERSYLLSDISDEIGYTYPDVKITCFKDGDLTIHNEFTGTNTVIKKCKSTEVITLSGTGLIIHSSLRGYKINDDFNYEFLQIGNSISNRNNRISVTLPCRLEITYTPIIKDSPN